jgi:hypothetical protein
MTKTKSSQVERKAPVLNLPKDPMQAIDVIRNESNPLANEIKLSKSTDRPEVALHVIPGKEEENQSEHQIRRTTTLKTQLDVNN